jgi:quercetin dioxygenase-like cupin family protein
MAQVHATFGEVVAAGPLGAGLPVARSQTLVREHEVQISRLVLPNGHVLKPHRVSQHLVFQCLEGQIIFETLGRKLTLNAGDLCHIGPNQEHAVFARTDSSALLTLFGTHTPSPDRTGDHS